MIPATKFNQQINDHPLETICNFRGGHVVPQSGLQGFLR
jgi:hypothetical protein